MTDAITAQFAARQIALELDALRRDANRLSDDAHTYATTVANGHPAPGDASRLAQMAIQVAQQAARLNGARETVAYLAPTATEETPR